MHTRSIVASFVCLLSPSDAVRIEEEVTVPTQASGCSSNRFGIDFCNDWCNTPGKWGCGIGTMLGIDTRNTDNSDYTCSCDGCNGCGKEANFVMGTRSSNVCPSGYEQIANEPQCRNAAAALGKSFASSGSWSGSPKGCLSSEWDGRGVYYNQHASGSALNSVQAPICKQSAPTPEPTEAPTPDPTQAPTPEPTEAPTPDPTEAASQAGLQMWFDATDDGTIDKNADGRVTKWSDKSDHGRHLTAPQVNRAPTKGTDTINFGDGSLSQWLKNTGVTGLKTPLHIIMKVDLNSGTHGDSGYIFDGPGDQFTIYKRGTKLELYQWGVSVAVPTSLYDGSKHIIEAVFAGSGGKNKIAFDGAEWDPNTGSGRARDLTAVTLGEDGFTREVYGHKNLKIEQFLMYDHELSATDRQAAIAFTNKAFQAPSKPTPVTVVEGTDATNECPGGYKYITSSKRCAEVCEQLSGSCIQDQISSSSPKGCYKDSSNQIRFNPHTHGGARKGMRPICEQAHDLRYVKLPVNTIGCPADTALLSADECSVAAKNLSLNVVDQWLATAYNGMPSGCVYKPHQRHLLWNKCTSCNKHWAYEPVCKKNNNR